MFIGNDHTAENKKEEEYQQYKLHCNIYNKDSVFDI